MAGTIQQIAELAGVSRGTVDRALNNRGRINPEVAKKMSRLLMRSDMCQNTGKRLMIQ